MRFGFFDDSRCEYVITSPRTPLPWINYLGSEEFFTLCSNTAGGYSFYRDATLPDIALKACAIDKTAHQENAIWRKFAKKKKPSTNISR